MTTWKLTIGNVTVVGILRVSGYTKRGTFGLLHKRTSGGCLLGIPSLFCQLDGWPFAMSLGARILGIHWFEPLGGSPFEACPWLLLLFLFPLFEELFTSFPSV